MNTLLGASSRSLARLFLNESSEPLDHHAAPASSSQKDSQLAQKRAFSVKKKVISSRSTNGSNGAGVTKNIIRSLSYRMDRARKRQVFLRTYTLESADKSRVSKRVKSVFIKVKVLLVSAVTCCSRGRVGILKRWRWQGNVCASSPSSR